ncbi:hypothetical protein FJT64_018730 [Amphibalanus amphitrite]|uniref:Uncharacterized protein n=1 Tax=Amphibalanus amphitrite TaxID=1232801 RepID=A0A6A4V907_AMPAM|nr:hypothetical protein FJT64_012162 [Amphibalanus amphitrite]KAF0310236.1 hypothetical protein FJT64_018730 [Amphibalanus amphitrite]
MCLVGAPAEFIREEVAQSASWVTNDAEILTKLEASLKLDLQRRRLALEAWGVELELFSTAQQQRDAGHTDLKLRRDITVPAGTEALVPVQRSTLQHAGTRQLEPDLSTTVFTIEQLRDEQRMDPQISPVRAALLSEQDLSTEPEGAEAYRPVVYVDDDDAESDDSASRSSSSDGEAAGEPDGRPRRHREPPELLVVEPWRKTYRVEKIRRGV